MQHGISTWDIDTEYQAGKSYVTGNNGKVYVAIQTHTSQNPVTDTTEVYWADIFKQGQVFITASQTWTVPPILKLGLKKASVEVYGAGGGGARLTTSPGPAGGGQGGIAYELIDLTSVASVSITIGAGGIGGATDGSTGTSGGTSSFGGFCSASGGSGGGIASSSAGGGSGINGDLNIVGASSGVGSTSGSGSIFGGHGGGGSSPSAATGGGPTFKGHGGGGRTTSAGQNGADGLVIIRW
ncbi:hypothetical protein D9M71_262750 [compost metagenome]